MEAGFARIVNCTPAGTPALPGMPTSYSSYWLVHLKKNKLFIAKNAGLAALRDSYILEFLDVPENHREKELRRSIVSNLRGFILEFGKDLFSFVGEEYRIQVGNKDFYVDLLFYNRELSCLVAIELKVVDFSPEHLGQMEFYSTIKSPKSTIK